MCERFCELTCEKYVRYTCSGVSENMLPKERTVHIMKLYGETQGNKDYYNS
jgi:hypothetical protein